MYSVTVIVPVYNIEQYIEKCARSLFEQTIKDLEIIFIDDCSPDKSIQIINEILIEYPDRVSSTRIVKLSSNSGLAAVRRRGIIESKGEFLIHCDGDDWVDKDLYQTMYDEAIKSNLDVVICDFKYEQINGTLFKCTQLAEQRGKDIIKNWYHNTLHLSCANKLIRTSLHKDYDVLPWVGLNMWEDNGLISRLLYYSNKVGHISGPVYHYNRCNVGAMTAGYGIKQVNQMIAIAENISDFFKSKPDAKDFEKTVNAFKYLAKLNLITDSFENYYRYKTIFPESNAIVKELDREAFSKRGKIRFNMVRFGFAPLFIILFKIKKLFHK